MGVEIERKYLVTDDQWRALPLRGILDIKQGYLPRGFSMRLEFSKAAYGFEFSDSGKKVKFSVPITDENRDFADVAKAGGYDEKSGKFTAVKGNVMRIRSSLEEGRKTAYLTIKCFNGDAEARDEFELAIPYDDAEYIMKHMCEDFVSKDRHLVEYKGKVWEVDVFKGKLKGLTLAELEVDNAAAFEGLEPLPGAEENVTEYDGIGNRDLGRDGIPEAIKQKLAKLVM